MDLLKTIVSEFLLDLRTQKLRAFLTMFGIVWGTVAIVVLIAFGMGFKKQTASNMHGIGESIAIMFPGKTTKPWEGFGIGRPMSFVEEDAWMIKSRVKGVKAISPEFGRRVPTHVGENILTPLVSGIYPVYGEMRNIIPEQGGRFINEPDMENRRRVAMIGNKVKEFLFGDQDAIGKLIYVGDVPLQIIGVMQPKTQPSSYNSRDRDRIFIPATTYASMYGAVHLNNIIYQVYDPMTSDPVRDEVRAVLASRYKFDPTDQDAVWIWDTSEFDKFSFYLFLGLNIFLGLIGSFTLGVAGIGVANIMYIVVQERIKEIGIKRAVGAKKANILAQFFLESFFIVGIGSAIGFLLSLGIVFVLQSLPIKDFVGTPVISSEVVVTTIAILGLVGLFAGLMPARRASNLDVVECLRT